MFNKFKTHKLIRATLLTLILAVGALMPLIISAQEGGRTRSGPRVTCTTTTYYILLITIVVTECSDGTTSTSIS